MRLTLKTLLIGQLSCSALALVALGGAAWTGTAAITHDAEELGGNWLQSVDATHAINTIVSDLRIAEAEHVMSVEAAEKGNGKKPNRPSCKKCKKAGSDTKISSPPNKNEKYTRRLISIGPNTKLNIRD